MYKYSRDEIYKAILFSPQTKGGVFWNSKIAKMLKEKGNEKEQNYLLRREFFFEKVFYTYKDLAYLLATTAENLCIKAFVELNNSFNNDNGDILTLKLFQKINNLEVKEIIDNYLLINGYYFSI